MMGRKIDSFTVSQVILHALILIVKMSALLVTYVPGGFVCIILMKHLVVSLCYPQIKITSDVTSQCSGTCTCTLRRFA